MMQRRTVKFGDFDTASQFVPWTLAELKLSAPEVKTNYTDIPGANGSLDLTCAVSGEPVYYDRELSAAFETSEGSRAEREKAITDMMNQLHGKRLHIVLPDDPDFYLDGRVSVSREYNDMAHARVAVSATCTPYRLKRAETVVTATLTTKDAELVLTNARMPVVPTVSVSAETLLTIGSGSYTFSAGQHQLLALLLAQGEQRIKARVTAGTGTITITYREGML